MAPTGDMFQRKIDDLCHELSNIFGSPNDILIVGSNDLCRDHSETADNVLKIYRKANLSSTKINATLGAPLLHSLGRLYPETAQAQILES